MPRLLAMLCVLAVFIPSFFMQGAVRELFVPLALSVGFAMVTSYLLSSTFVPVLSVWLLRHRAHETEAAPRRFSFARLRSGYAHFLHTVLAWRWVLVGAYVVAAGLVIWLVGTNLGREIFPTVDTGQLQLRLKAPDGTSAERTEQIAIQALDIIGKEAGPDNVEITLGYVGLVPTTYPINNVFLWTRGPEEAVLRVRLKDGSGVRVEDLKERLRRRLPEKLGEQMKRQLLAEGLTPDKVAERVRGLAFSFEPADIVNEVMSFGSPTPIEVAVSGPNLGDNRAYS